MPRHLFADDAQPEPRHAVDPAPPTRDEDELALVLPAWDLLPVAEFIRRHRPDGQ